MTKIGTLKELGVQPGDVVEYNDYKDAWVRGVIKNNMVAEMANGLEQPVAESKSKRWRLISRAPETPKLWRDMTPEEKGALLLAHHEGKVIEYKDGCRWTDCRYGPYWCDYNAYRVKPARTKSEWSEWLTSKADGTTKLDLGECADVDRVALGGGPQFAYRVKKWVE